jgi:hypothetical protein
MWPRSDVATRASATESGDGYPAVAQGLTLLGGGADVLGDLQEIEVPLDGEAMVGEQMVRGPPPGSRTRDLETVHLLANPVEMVGDVPEVLAVADDPRPRRPLRGRRVQCGPVSCGPIFCTMDVIALALYALGTGSGSTCQMLRL